MTTLIFTVIVCLIPALGGLAQQETQLTGSVLTSDRKPLPGVEVTVVGGGRDVTTSKGQFRFSLPALKPGQRVKLLVFKEGWEVIEPRDLSVIVPSDPVAFPIIIVMRQAVRNPSSDSRRKNPPLLPPSKLSCTGRLLTSASSFSVSGQYDPSGIMGDVGDIKVNRSAGIDRFAYEVKGKGPHEWDFKYVDGELNSKSARFAGVMYLSPPNNWGRERGFDLRRLRRVIKWEARSVVGEVNVEFVIGGIVWKWDSEKKEQIDVRCPDSMPRTSFGTETLTTNWHPFEWDLSQLPEDSFIDVIGAFGWTISLGSNGVDLTDEEGGSGPLKTFRIELRNIRYEGVGANEKKNARTGRRRAK